MGKSVSLQDYAIPPELQETLLDFTVHYLVERPPDILDFALEYFGSLAARRAGAGQHSEDEEMESEEDLEFGEFRQCQPISMTEFSPLRQPCLVSDNSICPAD